MSLVLDFLEKALPTAGAVAGGILGEAVDPFGGGIIGAGLGSALGQGVENKVQGKSLTSNVLQAGVGGAVGQGVGSLASGFIEGAAPGLSQLEGVGGKAVGGAVKGAAVGGVANTASSVAAGQPVTGKNLSMDFLQGAATGGATGGVLSGGAEAIKNRPPLNEMGSINNPPIPKPSDALTPEQLSAIAKSDDPKKIAKQLTPVTGPVVAQEIAPGIATDTDPGTVKNQVDNAINSKVPSPAPEPITPPTPVSNVNTPTQVEGQATAASASYTPEQASLDATAPPIEKPFINAPGQENLAPTHVGNLAATTQLHDDLQSGNANVDEAMNKYMETTGASYGDARSAVGEVMKTEGFDKSQVNSSLNPQFGKVDVPIAQAGDNERPVLNSKTIWNTVARKGNPAVEAADRLSDNDQKLLAQLGGNDPKAIIKQADDPTAFADVAKKIQDYNDYTQAVGAHLGQDISYKQNHGITFAKADTQPGGVGKAQLPTDAGYTKGATYANRAEAEDAGVQMKFDNPVDDLRYDLQRRANNLSQLALAKGLEEANPGQVKVGQIGTNEEGTFKQLLIPGGNKISLPAEIANPINERAPAPDAKGFLGGYDKINSEFKNMKLAGGGFHSLNVIGSYLGQQIASGRLFTHPEDTASMFKATFSDKSFKADVSNWEQNGKLTDMDAAGLVHNGEALAGPKTDTVEADVKGGPIANQIPGLKQLHDAVFGRQIPYMKMKIFDQLTEGLDRNNPNDLKQMTSVAKELNQNFGGLNRSIQGLTPQTFQKASRIFLATDYNEGQIRSLVDAFSKGGAEGQLARQVVFGKALLFAGAATAAGAAGGEFKNQTPKQVALDMLQKVINPEFKFGNYTVGLPTTQLSEFGKPALKEGQAIANGTSLKNPIEDVATSRLAAIPSAVEQLSANRNFSGNPIHGTDYYGRPISAKQTAGNLAGMVSPIPVSQGIQSGTGQQNIASGIANTIGLRATPTNNLNYAPIQGQTYVQELKAAGAKDDQVNADTEFFDLVSKGSKGRKQVINQAMTDIKAGDTQKAQQDIQSFNQKLIASLKPWQQDGNSQFLDQQMLQILRAKMVTFKTANSNIAYTTKTNPTSIGVSINQQAQQPQITANVRR